MHFFSFMRLRYRSSSYISKKASMIYRRDKTAALKFQQSTPATHCLSRTAHHARLTAHHALLILLIMHWARLRIYQRPTEQPTDSYIVDISKNQNGSIEIPAIHFSNALPIMHCSSCTAQCSSCTAHHAGAGVMRWTHLRIYQSKKADRRNEKAYRFVHLIYIEETKGRKQF